MADAVAAPGADARADDTAHAAPGRLRTLSRSTAFWILCIDILLVLVIGAFSEDNAFWSVASAQNIAADSSQALLLAVGVALLLGAGEFDVSLGASLMFASVVGGKAAIAVADSGTLVAGAVGVAVCVATGAAVGAVNGFVVTRMRVSSLIATLAMLGIATGVANIIVNGADLANIPPGLQTDFGIRTILGIPAPAFVSLLVFGASWVLVTTTRFGLRLLALGSSRGAAERAGLRTKAQLTVCFVLVGALAGLAGFIDLTRFATTNVAGHQTDALAALTAAVIGGTSLFGGRISMGGVLVGTVLAVILQNGLIILGLSAFYQLIAIGVVLIIAVFLDQRRKPATGRLIKAGV